MDTHVRVAAWLRIIWSAGALLAAIAVLWLLGGLSILVGGPAAGSWFMVVVVFVSTFFAVLALPGLLIGWGLLTYRPWARILDIALSAFDLFHVPLGTALGAYSIWVMLHPETAALFEGTVPPRRSPAHF